MATHEDDDDGTLHTDGGVSLFSGEPFVLARVGQHSWQWTQAEARAFAVLLVRTAGFAEDDAILLRQLRAMELPDEVVGGFISAVRNARVDLD